MIKYKLKTGRIKRDFIRKSLIALMIVSNPQVLFPQDNIAPPPSGFDGYKANIDHYYLIEAGKGHDWSVWKAGLYHFAQRIFGRVPGIDTTSTDISQYQSDIGFKIFYNPLYQTIKLFGNYDIKKLSIYDINGRLELSYSNISNNTLNIDQLSNGVYLVNLYDGKRNIHGKIILL